MRLRFYCKNLKAVRKGASKKLILNFSKIGRAKSGGHVWTQASSYVMRTCPKLKTEIFNPRSPIKCRFYDFLIIRHQHFMIYAKFIG
jgi:hypothetical protein